MFRIIATLAVVVVTAAAVTAASVFVTGTGRYELGVSLEYEGKSYTGSTVWELSVSASSALLPAPAIPTFSVRGEAIDIPIGDGRTLFVLRRSAGSTSSPTYNNAYLKCVPGDGVREKAAALSTFRGECELELEPWIVVADQAGKLETLQYDRSGSTGEVTILSSTARGTDKAIGAGIVDRHSWIGQLPSFEPVAFLHTIYREDFIRR